MEHHSNIVPWQILCEQTGAVLRVVPISDDGEFLLDEYEKLLNDRTRLVAVVHVSNALGTIAPVRRIIELAHARGAVVLLDGAQSAAHMPIDVRELDCDFFALSGHKIYGPTGIGALYGKAALLERMPPYQGGGDMIKSVTFAKTTYADLPSKFEAGTPHVAGAVGLGAALDYMQSIGRERIAAYEETLLRYATERMQQIRGVRLIGNAPHKAAVVSFVIDEPPIASLDIGTKLDLEGIAVAHRPSLLPAGDGSLRHPRHHPRFVRSVQHDGRDRCLSRRAGPSHRRRRRQRPARRSGKGRRAGLSPRRRRQSATAAEELIEEFDLFDDWVERYQYLIDRGEEIPPLPDALRTESNRVRGCQSTVYLWARKRPGTADTIEFLADSDADIVRGLIAVLERLFSGQRAEAILSFDIEGFFARLGLDQHLTLGRRNGLASMVQRIRHFAATLAGHKE